MVSLIYRPRVMKDEVKLQKWGRDRESRGELEAMTVSIGSPAIIS